MAEELATLERTGTWDLVPPLPVFILSREHGRDYDDTFAHVAHMTNVRTLLVVASVRHWSVSQLDVQYAFLNGELSEEEKYIQDLLVCAAPGDERTVETPMELNVKLRPTDVIFFVFFVIFMARSFVTFSFLVLAPSSSSAIQMLRGIARDPVKHELTKHIGVDAFYTRAQVQAQVVALQYVPSDLQLADFFTKAQTIAQHTFFLSKLSVVEPP
uniref:Uncharacterized protein n=1 Tax=Avena sativa TaxID=4498 RepID=A0ACD5V608_AVESA